MNKFPFYVLGLVSLLLFTQCKKDDVIIDPVTPENPVVTPPAKQLKSITNLTPQTSSTEYTWDDKGHLTKVLYHTGMYSTYTFSGKNVAIKLYVNDEDYNLTATGTLNDKGAFTQITGTLFQEGEIIPYSLNCEYNAAGEITKSTAKEGDKTEVFELTWTNGNLTGLKEYRQGVLSFTSVYTYDTNIPNKSGFDVGTNFLESTGGCAGVRSKNLLINSKRTQLSNNTLVQNATYTYELDNENYITKLTYADAVYNSNYPYQYNY